MKISKKQLKQIIKEELANENNSYGNFNPSDGVFDDEQARLQSGASIRRFEQDLDALVDDALDRGIPKEDIAEILKMFAGSV